MENKEKTKKREIVLSNNEVRLSGYSTTIYLKVVAEVNVSQTISLKKTSEDLMKKCEHVKALSTASLKS